ncbi:MAG: hypothetical protein ACPGEG_07785 [Salibacteraceae bacterium]
MKWVKILLSVLAVCAVVVGASIVYLSLQYGTIVESLVVEALNKNLNSEVKISSVETGSIEDLPYFSLVFNEVAIMESKEFQTNTDTLIYVDRLSLNFNIWDIYFENYQLKKVSISDGFGRFKVDAKGVKNYIFWKSTESDSTSSESFSFNLNEVEINNIEYSYVDKGLKFGLRTQGQSVNLSGNFTSENLQIKTQGSFNKTVLQIAGVGYINNRDLEINTGLEIDPETGDLTFMPGEIRVDHAFVLNPSGYINGNGYKFLCSSSSISLDQLNSLVPKKFANYQKKYNIKGNAVFEASIYNENESKLPPRIEANFEVNEGFVELANSLNKAKEVSVKGSFSNGDLRSSKTSKLVLDNISATFHSGSFSGSMNLEDFDALILTSSISGKVDLSEITGFTGLDSIGTIQGKLDFKGDIKFYLSRLLADKLNLYGSKVNGYVQFEDVNFSSKEYPIELAGFGGALEFVNWEARLISGIGKLQSTNFELNAETNNYLYWAFSDKDINNGDLKISADVNLDNVKLEEFLFFSESNAAKSENSKYSNYQIRVESQIDNFSFKKFDAKNLHSKVFVTSEKMVINPIALKLMDGEADGRLMISNIANGAYAISGESEFRQTNVQKLFYVFNDFNQTEITSDNLKGIADVSVNFSGIFDSELKLKTESLKAKSSIRLKNGELINYRTLQLVSDYFKKNVVLKKLFNADKLSKALEHVKFDELSNDILVQNEKVILPKMFVGSSVLGINVEGVYRLDETMDYRLDFNINELLLKDKTKAQSDDYSWNEEGNGVRVFLHMFGSVHDPTIEIDKEKRKSFKLGVRTEEKKELKSALKEEFGWFESDSTLDKKENKIDFEIEWEESEKPIDSVPAQPKLESNKKTKLKNLFKSKEQDDEEFDFGDDDF